MVEADSGGDLTIYVSFTVVSTILINMLKITSCIMIHNDTKMNEKTKTVKNFIALSFELDCELAKLRVFAIEVIKQADGTFKDGRVFHGDALGEAAVIKLVKDFKQTFVKADAIVVLDLSKHRDLQAMTASFGVPFFVNKTFGKELVWAWIQKNLKVTQKLVEFARENGIFGLGSNVFGDGQARFIAELFKAGHRLLSENISGNNAMEDADDRNEVTIYTDGSLMKAEGAKLGSGGWAFAVMQSGNLIKSGIGGCACGSPDNVELLAIWQALNEMKDQKICIVCDASQVIGRIVRCVQTGMADEKYAELVGKIAKQVKANEVRFKQIKAHSGVVSNELVDAMAKAACIAFRDNGNQWS